MATEIQEQAVKVSLNTLEVSAKTLKELIITLVRNQYRIQHGEQRIAKLNLQNRQLDSVELAGEDIKAFRRELNKYAVDFSVVQDRKKGTYSVYFKGQDVERVYQGLRKCVEDFDKVADKKPMQETMQTANIRAQNKEAQRAAPTEKITADRGHDAR